MGDSLVAYAPSSAALTSLGLGGTWRAMMYIGQANGSARAVGLFCRIS
jgi:hypothetical protein